MTSPVKHFDVIVIGGGQSGLATGYHLARHGLNFTILEARERIGDIWRSRRDSLRLFSPARYDGLPGRPFPLAKHLFPTRDQMADYLEAYAKEMALPVQTGIRVDGLWRGDDGGYVLTASDRRFEARHVVLAAGKSLPKIPDFAAELDAVVERARAAGVERMVTISTRVKRQPEVLAIAVFMPITSPRRLMSGPPLLPGLMAASV